jgi:hypothetical protein
MWQGSVSPWLEGNISPAPDGCSMVEFCVRVPRAGWRYWLEHFAVVAVCLQILAFLIGGELMREQLPELSTFASFALAAFSGLVLSLVCMGGLVLWYAWRIRVKAAKLLRFWRQLVDDVHVLPAKPAGGNP